MNDVTTWLQARAARLLTCAIGGVFAMLFFQQARQLYVIDEAEFPLVGRAVAELGRPEYYRGEDLPTNLGVWHPPGYPYALGVWEQFFGDSHTAVRAFGLFCAALAAFFGWLILARLFPRAMPWLGAAWLATFLLHPYVIQSALLPDIDSTVLVAISALCLWLTVRVLLSETHPTTAVALGLGAALGAAFLCKLTTPIALIPPMIIALAVASRSPRRAAGLSALMLATSAIVFTVVWGSLSRLADLPFRYPFEFTRESLGQKAGGQSLSERLELLWPSKSVLFWLTPALLILFGVGSVIALLAVTSRRGVALCCISLFAISIFLTYNVITGPPFGFPKYYAPAMGAVTLVAIAPLAYLPEWLSLRSTSTRRRLALVVVITALVIVALAYVQFGRNRTVTIQPLRPAWFLVAVAVATVLVIALSVGRSGLPPIERRRRFLRWAGIVWGAWAITTVGTAFAVSLQQRGDSSSIRYFPGERDFRETVSSVKDIVGEAEPGHLGTEAQLISAKDIGFEAGLRYYEDGFYLGRPDVLATLLTSRPGMTMVTRSTGDFGLAGWPGAAAVLQDNAHPVWESPSGSFTIWAANSPAEAQR